MDAPVRIAVVGLGYWGPNLVRNLHEVSCAEPIWVCDLRRDALDAMTRRYPALRATTSFDEVLADEDVDLDEVAEWLSTYTIADNLPDEAPGADRVPEGRLDETLFAGAFSSNFLQDLTPEEIESFGEGSYPEGRIYDPPSAGQ